MIHLLVDQKVFLLCAYGGDDAADVFAEQMQQALGLFLDQFL